jgi:hypothetical protein
MEPRGLRLGGRRGAAVESALRRLQDQRAAHAYQRQRDRGEHAARGAREPASGGVVPGGRRAGRRSRVQAGRSRLRYNEERRQMHGSSEAQTLP